MRHDSQGNSTHVNLVQCNVTLVVHRRCNVGIRASLIGRRVTLGLLACALISSLIVVGRRLAQSIVARRAVAAVVRRLLGKLTGIRVGSGHLLK